MSYKMTFCKLWDINAAVLVVLSLLSSAIVNAEVLVTTDNQHDIESFETMQKRSLSAESNILALGMKENFIQLVPFKRSIKLMDEGYPVCVINRLKTPAREEKYIFSKPTGLFLNRRLYQHSDLKTENISIPINLIELFSEYPERRLIVSNQHSYGENLDKRIASLDDKYKIVRSGAIHNSRGVVKMFVERRGDYALFQPSELYEKEFNISTTSFPLEGVKPYILSHIMCSKTKETSQFIAEVNDRLVLKKNRDALLNIHLKYNVTSESQNIRVFFEKEF